MTVVVSRQTLAPIIDPFTKRHKLVHNGRCLKSEVLYCRQNTVKLMKIQ